MDSNNGMQQLRAQVPQAEMFHYATELRSVTQGRGSFAWRLDHYAEVPHNVAEKVIAEHASNAAAGEKH
jgi:elongation factor G